MAFAFCAAGAVDGADIIMAVGGVLQSGRAVGQAEDAHGGADAPPLSLTPVVGPVGADGTEVFLVTVVSLKEDTAGINTEEEERPADISSCWMSRFHASVYRHSPCVWISAARASFPHICLK